MVDSEDSALASSPSILQFKSLKLRRLINFMFLRNVDEHIFEDLKLSRT